MVEKLYQDRENALGTDQVRGLERWQVMRSIDEHWMEHLAEMDTLRDAIWQQGYSDIERVVRGRARLYARHRQKLDGGRS